MDKTTNVIISDPEVNQPVTLPCFLEIKEMIESGSEKKMQEALKWIWCMYQNL